MKKTEHKQADQVDSAELGISLDGGRIEPALVLEKPSSKRKRKSDRQRSASVLAGEPVGSSINEDNPKDVAKALANKFSEKSSNKKRFKEDANSLADTPIGRPVKTEKLNENVNDLADESVEGSFKEENLMEDEEQEKDARSSTPKKKRRVSFGGVTVLGTKGETAPEAGFGETNTPFNDRYVVGRERRGSWKADHQREDLVWAKRFTKEEDELLKKTILEYFKRKGWAETDSLNDYDLRSEHDFWKDIAQCLPHRPLKSIQLRAHRLMDGKVRGKWSKEEESMLLSLFEEHGHDWQKISTILGRFGPSVKDKWRLLKLERAKGRWTQRELTRLCEMVHENLRLVGKIGKHRKENDHRELRDNINWQLISDRLGTRPHSTCANEWYRTLASSMVAKGEWGNEDDRTLLLRLLELDENDEEAVEWDGLLQHRSGSTCRKRWNLMVKHLGESSHVPFGEKLKLLTKRYAPDLLEDQ